MKVALHSISYAGLFYRGPGLSLEEIIPKAAALGYEGVEVMGKAPVCSPFDFDERRAQRAVELAREHGVDLCFFAGYFDLNRPDRVEREKELVFARESLRLAGQLGCPYVRVYAGGDHVYEGATLWQQWDWTIEGITRLLPVAQEAGVRLALEVHTGVAQNVDTIRAMMLEVGWDAVDICLDAPLLYLRGEPIAESVRLFGGKIVHSHATDLEILPPMIRYHDVRGLAMSESPRVASRLMGQGKVPQEEFMRACYQVGYDRYFAYEVCTPFTVEHRPPTMEDVDRMVAQAAGWLKDKRDAIVKEAM
ncbi:MAG: sugar phosphate isomerase/epimerase [Anaerolineae bacterium]|nr:sugar phosphate isomerase/epimerase [Anaerolineae bacterium]